MNLADARPRDDLFTPLGDWINEAACREAEPSWFVWDGPGDAVTLRRAVALCASCPVRGLCAADAVRNNAVGLWGGYLHTFRGKPVNLVKRLHDAVYWRYLRSRIVDQDDQDGAA